MQITKTVSSFGGSLISLKKEASGYPTTLTAHVAPAILEGVERLKEEPIFGNVDFERINIYDFLTKISFEGSAGQRTAVAACMTPAAAMSLPGIWDTAKANSKSYEIVDKLLQVNIQSLAAHYGVEFRGEIGSVTQTILREFGGLSPLDFLIFFERAKMGRYKTDMQHINVRGINFEFLQSWLTAYAEDRQAEWEALYASGKNRNDGEQREAGSANPAAMPDLVKQMQSAYEKRKAERDALRAMAVDIRIQWEKSATVEDRFRRMILNYLLFFKSDTIEKVVSDFNEMTQKKYGEGWEAYKFTEMNSVRVRVEKFKRQVSAESLLRVWVLAKFPDAEWTEIEMAIASILKTFKNTYTERYLPECIELNYPPLHEPDYVWQCALFEYRKHTGENPIYAIIFE
jgi:hypothetical protein